MSFAAELNRKLINLDEAKEKLSKNKVDFVITLLSKNIVNR